jgi:hypothetical protein
MANYAEFLKSQGATDAEIAVLDTPVARKAYEKMEAATAEAATARAKAEQKYKDNLEWKTQVEAQNQEYLKERDSAKVEAAAAAARIAKMAELGLIEVAERMEPGSTKPKDGETPAFDPKVLDGYVDRKTLLEVAEHEGDAIATAQDIAYEHSQLFGNDPSKRLNFRELRKEAVSRKVSVEALWMERYSVQAAREAAAAKSQAAHEAKIAADAVTKYKSEHPETNPMLATPGISRTPFTGRIPSDLTAGTVKQPWQVSDSQRQSQREQKVIAKLAEQGLVN